MYKCGYIWVHTYVDGWAGVDGRVTKQWVWFFFLSLDTTKHHFLTFMHIFGVYVYVAGGLGWVRGCGGGEGLRWGGWGSRVHLHCARLEAGGEHSIYRWWISLKCSFQVLWSRSKCFNGRIQRNNSSRGFGPLGNMRVKLIQRKYIVFWSSKRTSNIPQINMMSKFAFCLASAGKCVVYEYIICDIQICISIDKTANRDKYACIV